jgi:protein NrfD
MPDDQTARRDGASHAAPQRTPPGEWRGETYYGRNQVKHAPFNNWVVGGYIFLAGLSGGTQILSTLADLTRGRAAAPTVRRGRYLAMLAPTIGSAMLVWDLHTPARFYNMFRIFRGTSPMSIGTYVLTAFTGFAGLTAAAQFMADRSDGAAGRVARRAAGVAQVPAAIAGAGLATYTAALLSATSTPLWAAAPKSLAARYASASLAAAAGALVFGREDRTSRAMQRIALAALGVELAAGVTLHRAFKDRGVSAALDSPAGRVEKGVTVLGTVLPMGLLGASLLSRRLPSLASVASVAVLAGSAALRIATMAAGNESALRPEISFAFTEKEH